jgi:hypothetical protein
MGAARAPLMFAAGEDFTAEYAEADLAISTCLVEVFF